MNHKELVKLAGQWLENSKSCNPVFMERVCTAVAEIPDAIGWTRNDCIVVECKTSRQDIIANSKKCLSMGSLRYFLMEKELYAECENIISEGYGILLVEKPIGYTDNLGVGYCKAAQLKFKGSTNFERNLKNEVLYLRSRILGIQNYGRV